MEMVLQGIYRKPHQCRERHKFLFEQLGTDTQENSHDLSPLQPSNAQPAGIPKVCVNCLSTGDFHMYPTWWTFGPISYLQLLKEMEEWYNFKVYFLSIFDHCSHFPAKQAYHPSSAIFLNIWSCYGSRGTMQGCCCSRYMGQWKRTPLKCILNKLCSPGRKCVHRKQ